MMKTSCYAACRALVVVSLFAVNAAGVELVVQQNGGVTELKLLPPGSTFHTTAATVTEPNLIDVDGSTLLLMNWKESVSGCSPRSPLRVQLRRWAARRSCAPNLECIEAVLRAV